MAAYCRNLIEFFIVQKDEGAHVTKASPKQPSDEHPRRKAEIFFDQSPEAVLPLIYEGESQTVEFKRRLISDREVARTLAAFANSSGGILLVGVGPEGEVEGLSEDEARETVERLLSLGFSIFNRPIRAGSLQVAGQLIAFAVIQPVPEQDGPVLTAEGIYYRRRADRNVRHRLAAGRRPPRGRPKRLFVAMSFREEEEPALVDYFEAMRRAVRHTGLPIAIERIDLVEGDYEISQQVMEEIDRADIVLTDLTLNPANVYFELGNARGRNKRVIQTARRDTVLEFDVRNWKTIFYRNATELERLLVPELRDAYNDVR